MTVSRLFSMNLLASACCPEPGAAAEPEPAQRAEASKARAASPSRASKVKRLLVANFSNMLDAIPEAADEDNEDARLSDAMREVIYRSPLVAGLVEGTAPSSRRTAFTDDAVPVMLDLVALQSQVLPAASPCLLVSGLVPLQEARKRGPEKPAELSHEDVDVAKLDMEADAAKPDAGAMSETDTAYASDEPDVSGGQTGDEHEKGSSSEEGEGGDGGVCEMLVRTPRHAPVTSLRTLASTALATPKVAASLLSDGLTDTPEDQERHSVLTGGLCGVGEEQDFQLCLDAPAAAHVGEEGQSPLMQGLTRSVRSQAMPLAKKLRERLKRLSSDASDSDASDPQSLGPGAAHGVSSAECVSVDSLPEVNAFTFAGP